MSANLTKVPILVRWVLSGDGNLKREMNIYCPFQSRVLRPADCANCQYSTKAKISSSEPQELFVACRHPGEDDLLCDCTKSADCTRVSNVMHKEVFCVKKDVHAQALISLFIEHGFSGAPIVDGNWKPLGIVSKSDLVWERYNGEQTDAPWSSVSREDQLQLGTGFHLVDSDPCAVSEIMTPLAFTVRLSTALSQAAALMACERVHRVPVVSPEGGVVGVLSALDVLNWLGQKYGYLTAGGTRCRRPQRRHEVSEEIVASHG